MDYAEVIRNLEGTVDGANRDFSTPTKFVLGTFRAIVNGSVYAPDDDDWGFQEMSEYTIRFNTAPKVGFDLQGYYREPVVDGSPIGPPPIP